MRSRFSTHGLGLVEAFQLAEVIGCHARDSVIFTIEARDIFTGRCPLSDEVARQLESLVESILADLGAECTKWAPVN